MIKDFSSTSVESPRVRVSLMHHFFYPASYTLGVMGKNSFRASCVKAKLSLQIAVKDFKGDCIFQLVCTRKGPASSSGGAACPGGTRGQPWGYPGSTPGVRG